MSTILASNFITNLSFNFQPRLLLLSHPRLRRNVVRCLSDKSNGSELPVRYIPKKHRDVNQAQSSSSGGKTLKNANGTRSSSSSGVLGHKTLDRMERPRRSKFDHEQSNVASDDAHVHVVSRVNDDHKHGKRDVETKSRKVHQRVVEYMNVPQGVVGELQNIKRDVQGQGCKSNQENSYDFDDAFRKLDRMERSQRSRIDHEQSNVAFDDAHVHVVSGVNDDHKHVKRDAANKSRKVHQEVVEYMNVPQEVVGELQNLKRDVQGQGCKFNQESSYDYDDVFRDSEYMEPLEEDVEEKNHYIGVGDGKEKRSDTSRIKKDGVKLAAELLAKRAFTGVELRKKLTAKNFPVNVVDTVLSDFQNRGLINDSLYAEMFSHSRWKSSSWGPRRIKQALVKKGVNETDVEKAIKVVFEDDEDSDRGSSMKLSESSLQNLYVQASKQWQRSQNVPHETRKARLIRWLQYRGFDWGVVSNMLKKLESNHPP